MSAVFSGCDVQSKRKLILHSVRSAFDVPDAFLTDGYYFIAMLVWDAERAGDREVLPLARKLINAGCACIWCWGGGCERVHDLFDEAWVADVVDDETENVLMTTWHADETLDSFIYFALRRTKVTSKYAGECRTSIALVIGDTNRASAI